MSRVLLVTIPPFDGGVPAKCAILARHLRALGHDVTVAYYATHGHEPDLVAPSWRLAFGARPRVRRGLCFGDFPAIGVGSWLPELEVTYYLPSRLWSDVLAAHDRHIAVGGNVLVAYRLAQAGIPHLVWCGTPLLEDRLDRQVLMPAPRRAFDRAVTVPLLRCMERRVLAASSMVLPVSQYSAKRLAALGRTGPMTVMPVPADERLFFPPAQSAAAGVVGFAGRSSDPRKNIGMLFEAVAIARAQGCPLDLRLTGKAAPNLVALANQYGVTDKVTFAGELSREDLAKFYQGLDLLAIPSRQEGLGIVGIEAMASGVPVVSTRNGGSEDYVIDGVTGTLTGFDAAEMAARLMELTRDRALRDRLGRQARNLAVRLYGSDAFIANLAAAWRRVWGDEP